MNKEQTEQLLADVAEIKKAVVRKKTSKSLVSVLTKPWFWFWAIVVSVLVLGGSLADLPCLNPFGGN